MGIVADTKIASIEIAIMLDEDGMNLDYAIDGIERKAAIGHLTVVLDRMREEERHAWSTCPACGRLWEDHEEDEV